MINLKTRKGRDNLAKVIAVALAVFMGMITVTQAAGRRSDDPDDIQRRDIISDSAVHDYSVYLPHTGGETEEAEAESTEPETVLIELISEETAEEAADAYSNPDNGDNYDAAGPEPSGLTEELSFRERIIRYAAENYGVSEEWTIWLIGTTHNEGYQGDRYLEYAWSCEILNVYTGWSVWDLNGIWGPYYSIENAYAGYYAADDVTLSMVWEALTDRDTRIVEVDGMIRWEVPGYYLIYDSDVYNCQVWGQ